MKNGGPVLLVCESDWGRIRRTALRLKAEGVRSVALVRITPGPELRELIRMIPVQPLIRQSFISKKIFRLVLPFQLAFLLLTRRIGRVLVDRERTSRSIAPWLQYLGVRCEMAS